MYKLLTINNPKTLKGFMKYDKYITAIMHLKPINTKICPYQDIAKCKEACLNTAGRGGIFKKEKLPMLYKMLDSVELTCI